jgi:YggT family protein
MAGILCLLINLYLLIIFARIIASWVVQYSPPAPGSAYAQIVNGLTAVTEPVLAPVRGVLPPVRLGGAGLDLSPIAVIIVGTLLARAIC